MGMERAVSSASSQVWYECAMKDVIGGVGCFRQGTPDMALAWSKSHPQITYKCKKKNR